MWGLQAVYTGIIQGLEGMDRKIENTMETCVDVGAWGSGFGIQSLELGVKGMGFRFFGTQG